MEAHTERQLKAWLAWLDLQWDRPDRTDHYLMRLTQELRALRNQVAGILGGRVDAVPPLGEFKIDFGVEQREAAKPKSNVTPEQAALWSKCRWGMALGTIKSQAN